MLAVAESFMSIDVQFPTAINKTKAPRFAQSLSKCAQNIRPIPSANCCTIL